MQPADSRDVLVRLRGISKHYGDGETRVDALRNVSLQVHATEVVALLGPSGSGKTTLLNVIGCIVEPSGGWMELDGDVVYDGRWLRSDLRRLRLDKIGFIFQFHNLLPFLDATDNVALMLHLAATEIYYQLNTFKDMKADPWPASVKQEIDAAMRLGDAGRNTVKGHDRDYYLKILAEVRVRTLSEFRKRDDAWLMAVDKYSAWGPTNNLCKWFHVCEHEAQHSGQIAFLRSRLPGGKTSE